MPFTNKTYDTQIKNCRVMCNSTQQIINHNIIIIIIYYTINKNSHFIKAPVVHCATRFEIALLVVVITRCKRGRRITGKLVGWRLPRAQVVTVTTAVDGSARYRQPPTIHGTYARPAATDANGSYQYYHFFFSKIE